LVKTFGIQYYENIVVYKNGDGNCFDTKSIGLNARRLLTPTSLRSSPLSSPSAERGEGKIIY
jgi:hypothetical protein